MSETSIDRSLSLILIDVWIALDHPKLISNARVAEWSCHLHEAMHHYFQEPLLNKASQTLPQHTCNDLDAHQSSMIDTAKEEAKCIYFAELQCLQSDALEEAECDFDTWKNETLILEWQAKKEALKAEKFRELDTF